MQLDFHYYATYCAARLSGYSPEECLAIAWSDQFTDVCTRTFLSKIRGPLSAATTQLQLEMVDADTSVSGLQDITRIWASFHFLPRDLYAEPPKGTMRYRRKYRLICGPNGSLVKDTVELAKGKSLEAAGIAMHVLADTWAHRFFAGTPSFVINDTNYVFSELIPSGDGFSERPIRFIHNPMVKDDFEKGVFVNTIGLQDENSIMNLGHGRAGHLPDYSFARYRYMPAWTGYREVIKDNPDDYMHAFRQMITALRYLRGEIGSFETEVYEEEAVAPWEARIEEILNKRQIDACADWKAFGEELSGEEIPDFEYERFGDEYLAAPQDQKDDTAVGRYVVGALAQNSLVTNKIFTSGSKLAGYSIDYRRKGFRGISDFEKLVERERKGGKV